MTAQSGLRFLEDRWDDAVAAKLDAPELLRYRSNLLGSDLRITNFGGGNTSSKLEQVDPLDGKTKQILWVKGSGGDLGSIKRTGFATLYMDKLLALEKAYRGVELEDEMVEMYPLCRFGNNPVAASIDTPLHGFLPFRHGDHLHPDWGIAASIMPYLRGAVSRKQRWIGSFSDSPQVLEFVNSAQSERLAHLGTSCPDHFIRTKIRPMFIKWNPAAEGGIVGAAAELKELIEKALETYRVEYAEYYKKHAVKDSPAVRDASPTVVVVPGVGMFSFGKNKTESRITGEFYTNAIGVMQGAGALGAGVDCEEISPQRASSPGTPEIPQAGPAASADQFTVHANYVALPPSEAFRIEYWKLEEAKIRRQPPEKELSRRVALIVGGGGGVWGGGALLGAGGGGARVVAGRA